VPDEDGFYGTRQIVEVLYGSIYTERLKTQKELTRRLALQNFATTAAMLNRAGRRPRPTACLPFRPTKPPLAVPPTPAILR
jgi:hypothetical protein